MGVAEGTGGVVGVREEGGEAMEGRDAPPGGDAMEGRVTMRLTTVLVKGRGSYLSERFSSRFESSSNTDRLDSSDLTMSEG